MLKIFLTSLLALTSVSSLYASNTMTFEQVRNQIQNVQDANNTQERGFIGNIIANIFNSSGRIDSPFIEAFNALDNMNIPYWNNGNFFPGALRQTAGTSGRVGIGVNPHSSARLNVDGTSRFTGVITANSGVGATNLNLMANNVINFATNGSQRMRIADNGNIGIARNPDANNRLRVNGNTRIDGNTHLNGNTRIDGTLNMRSNRITNLQTPTNNSDAATKLYVDSNIPNYTGGSGINISSSEVISVDNTVVRTTGNQSIGGTKTFNSGVGLGMSPGNIDGALLYVRNLDNPERGYSYYGSANIGLGRGRTSNGMSSISFIASSGSDQSAILARRAGVNGNLFLRNRGTGDIELVTHGLPRLVVKYGGRVGIGTSSPSAQLHVNGQVIASTPTAANHLATKAYVDSVGNTYSGGSGININTSNIVSADNTVVRTNGNQTIWGSKRFTSPILAPGIGSPWGTFNINAASRRLNLNVPETRMTILQNGRVGIGIWNPSHILHVAGRARSTNANWATTSDERLKENIQEYKKGLEELMRIRTVQYNYNRDASMSDEEKARERVGIIAQEIEQILPGTVEKVSGEVYHDERVFTADEITYLLINAVQEQQNLLQDKAKKIEDLSLRLSQLEKSSHDQE